MRVVNKVISRSLIGLAMMAAGVASASPVLWVGDSAGRLGTIDVATGAVNVIGSMGQAMTDIAFDPNGNLYAINFGSLFSINTSNAAATFIGNLGTSANSLVFDSSGSLFAANSSLFKVNVGTGVASLVGAGGTPYSSSGDLAFIGSDLFLSSALGSDSLVKINSNTGVGTSIGAIGYSAVYGLASDNNLDLYGLTGTTILNINSTTGSGTVVLNYAGKGLGEAWGSAFVSESGAVPEPGTVALMALGMMGIGYARRKSKVVA